MKVPPTIALVTPSTRAATRGEARPAAASPDPNRTTALRVEKSELVALYPHAAPSGAKLNEMFVSAQLEPISA